MAKDIPGLKHGNLMSHKPLGWTANHRRIFTGIFQTRPSSRPTDVNKFGSSSVLILLANSFRPDFNTSGSRFRVGLTPSPLGYKGWGKWSLRASLNSPAVTNVTMSQEVLAMFVQGGSSRVRQVRKSRS